MASGIGINVRKSSGAGAKFVQQYHTATQDVVGVPVMDIRESASYALEEVLLFAVGNFMASGAFWLGIERIITAGYKDSLFQVCLLSLLFGATLAFVGFRQMRRRVSRLSRYIPQEIPQEDAP